MIGKEVEGGGSIVICFHKFINYRIIFCVDRDFPG